MPGPDQLTEGLARVAASADETRLPASTAVRRRGEQRTRRQRVAALAATVCVVAGGALGAGVLLSGDDPETVPAGPTPTTTALEWPPVGGGTADGSEIWVVYLAIAPTDDDPVFSRTARRWQDITPYAADALSDRANAVPVRIEGEAATSLAEQSCPAIREDPYQCRAQAVSFRTQADGTAFVQL